GAGDVGQGFDIVRVIRAGHNWLVDFSQVDFDDGGVFGVGIGLEQLRVGQPLFHALDTTGQGALVFVAVGDHPLQQRDVAIEVFDDGLFVETNSTRGRRAFCRGVRQFERLLDLQVGQAFDFENAAGEDVFLALFFDSEQALLDGVVGDGIDQVTQGNARLHFALEAYQYRFGHIQRHDTRGCRKSNKARTCGEADTNGETGVRVAPGTDGVGQQHAVKPAVNNAVARAQRYTATGADEVGQFVVGADIDRLGVGGGVAERLHNEICREAQACQVFKLVAGHGARGVLATHGGHARFAIGAGANAFAFGQTAGATHHFLSQGVALAGINGLFGQAEQGGGGQAQRLAGTGRQATTDNKRDTAAGTYLVKQNLGFNLELGNDFTVLQGLAFVGTQLDDVAHFHLRHIKLDRQGAGVFHGVVEDGGNFAAQHNPAKALVGYVGNVFAGVPQHRVGGRFA